MAAKKISFTQTTALLLFASASIVPAPTLADEGGGSIWIPGFFGSLAAVPGDTGWSVATVYYHTSVSANRSAPFPVSGRESLGLDVKADLLFVTPTYTFETPVFGGQAASSLVLAYGYMDTQADVTLTGPRGNTFVFNPEDSVTAQGDMLSLNTLKWNDGVNNYLMYNAIAIPVGDYEQGRLANTSMNHWAADLGGGYTYFNTKSGREFSATLGFTYNFENTDTDYKNGIDGHLEWAASQFLNAQTHIGVVGYFFHQVSGDSGDGATLGDFKSRVNGVGPEIGHFFEVGNRKWYVNFKGYHEFDAENRPEGWSAWATLLIPLGEGKP